MLNYSETELLLAASFTALIGYLTYFTVTIYILRKKYAHIPGPPANGLIGFYFGNLFEISHNLRVKKRVTSQLTLDWIKKYGTTIKYQVANKIIVVTVDHQAIKEILIDKDFPKYSVTYNLIGYPYGERLTGRGILTETDQLKWKNRRNIFNPAFHKQVLLGFMNEFNYKSDLLLEKLRKQADGKTLVKLLSQFNAVALDIISHVAFGMETDALNDSNNKLNIYITKTLKGFMRYMRSYFWVYSRYFPSEITFKENYKLVIKELRNLGRKQILNRLKTIQDGAYAPTDLLTISLKESENEKFDLEDMIDDFVTFFVAGQETTANSLAFCFIELARNAEIVKKLRNELDSVLGSRNIVTNEDLGRLHYLSCVVKETLRLWTPANGTVREVNIDDFKINGLHIPKNTFIHISSFVTGRYEGNFVDSLQFKPERFMENENSINPYSYMPFSIGPRNCIGQNFAKIEMKIIIAKLIKNFDFELKADQNLDPVEYLTFRPKDGAQCFISARSV